MARRNRRKHWIESIPALAGLCTLIWVFTPQFRAILVALAVMVVFGLMAWTVNRVIWRKAKLGQSTGTGDSNPSPVRLTALLALGATTPPEALTPELLEALEWRAFEILVTRYFDHTGYQAKRRRAGADGGVDIELWRPGEERPFAIVQCKAWHVYQVGVKPVRELFGVMAAEQVAQGYFVTTGDFTFEARQFAQGKSLRLLSGTDLLRDFNALRPESQIAILHEITSGDYTTPTCPRCDIKMIERQANGDPRKRFWGCHNYPRCRQVFTLRKES